MNSECYCLSAICGNGLTSATGLAPCTACSIGSRFVNNTYCEPCATGFTTVQTGTTSACVPESSVRSKCLNHNYIGKYIIMNFMETYKVVCVCAHTWCVCVHVWIWVCMCMCACLRECMHECVRACVHLCSSETIKRCVSLAHTDMF